MPRPETTDESKHAGQSGVDRDLLDALVQTSFSVMSILNRHAARNDLSLTQVRLLGILRDRQPKMAELAAHLGLEKSTVSGLVDRAAHRGLVQRIADPDDARAARVALTPRGREVATSGATDIATDTAALIAPLSAAERAQLVELLRRVAPR